MCSLNIALIVLLTIVVRTIGYECDRSATVCETTLVITHSQTMLHDTASQVYPANGKLYRYDDVNQTTAIPADEVMTADGWEDNRLVVVANESLPGPPIIVYVGQRVKVRVINMLPSDTVTIHWHGLPLYGRPWMDGTPFLTQCPILPGQSFTYDFYAEPKGTHWYHSHAGNQRTKGLSGAFIIKERTSTAREHIMTIQDWNHNWDGDMDLQKLMKAQANR
ncbi:dihydrogeodin oxidase-like [Pecten maximus]|uniref:dihydrogeodin oxidase-like n=1 Tax=Pecten maximus TaxID=6579 RepID=UPI0014580A28|nr:dihydrogeodin oxidase-like [Pecten maximus]